MRDRINTIKMVIERFSEKHSAVCPKPNIQLMHNSDGMCGVGCLGCQKVIELPVLTGNPIVNLHKWEEALREAKEAFE